MDNRKLLLVRVSCAKHSLRYEWIPWSRRAPVAGIFGPGKQSGRPPLTNVVPSLSFVTAYLCRSLVPRGAMRLRDFVFTGTSHEDYHDCSNSRQLSRAPHHLLNGLQPQIPADDSATPKNNSRGDCGPSSHCSTRALRAIQTDCILLWSFRASAHVL